MIERKAEPCRHLPPKAVTVKTRLYLLSHSLPLARPYFPLLTFCARLPQVYMVMKGQGRSDGANSSGLKPSSAKFLGGSKNSEQVGSNPAPTIGGSMGSLDLFKLSDVNIQVTGDAF